MPTGQPLLAHARGRRQGGQGQPDPGGPRASAPRHRADRGLFARSQGAVRAHVRHLAEALPQELRLRGSPGSMRPTASSRRSIRPTTTPASRSRPRSKARPRLRRGALDDILCIQEERTVSGDDNTVRYLRRVLQLPADRHEAATTSRPRSGCTSIPTARSPSSTGPDAWRVYQTDGELPIDTPTRQAA